MKIKGKYILPCFQFYSSFGNEKLSSCKKYLTCTNTSKARVRGEKLPPFIWFHYIFSLLKILIWMLDKVEGASKYIGCSGKHLLNFKRGLCSRRWTRIVVLMGSLSCELKELWQVFCRHSMYFFRLKICLENNFFK